MRKTINFKRLVLATTILVLSIASEKLFAQVPSAGIFFQAVARDSYSNPAKDRKIVVETSLIQSTATGTLVLRESFETTTDAAGIFGVNIGQGTRLAGTASNLQGIEWSKGPFFLNIKVAVAPIITQSSWDYTKDLVDLGTSPFGAVPYAMYAGSVAGFDSKINALDTSKMLLPYAKSQTLTTLGVNKLNVADSITKYVTPTQLAAKTFDQTPILTSIASKLNVADSITKYVTPTQLASKTFDSTAIYNQLGLKENTANKSTNLSVDGSSNTKYPSVKSVKDYVDLQVASSIATIVDASPTVKGKIQLSGDLTGTAALPIIANNAVTTVKIADGNITNAKLATGIDATKITGDITGKASNITGNLAILNGGTGASSALGARANLGLAIGTDVQAPLSFTTPLVINANTISINQATTSVDGYLSATDFTSFNNKIDATQKAANNGVATLGNDGKIPSNQIPAISFQNVSVVNSSSAMTSISGAQVGSMAIRTDNNNNYVLSALPASTLSNWIPLATPIYVSTVNGYAGPNVVLTTNDVSEGANNKYYTDARVRSALSATSPLSFNTATGTFSMSAASASNNGYLTSTDFTTFNNKQNALTAGTDYLAPNGSAIALTNFPTLNQNTTGNAATATKLAATKNINGVPFDGSASINIDADANTLTGSTLASNVTNSSLTSVGTITSGVWSGTTIAIAKGGTGATTAMGALTNLGAEPAVNKSNDVSVDGSSTTKFPSVKAIKDYVDLQSANAGVADNSLTSAKINGTIAIIKGGTGASTAADARTNLGLVIGTDVMSANFTTTLTGDVTGSGNGSFATTVNSVGGITAATIAGLPTSVNANTASITSNTNSIATLNTNVSANTASITAETTRATNAENALDTRVTSNTTSITANTNSIASLNTNVSANTASITAETTRATNAESALDTRVTSNTTSITANTADILLRAPLASPAFTGTPTAPTPATNDNSTTLATTAYVKNSITAANAGLSSIGAISATSNAKGATISGTTELILTPADASNGGVVTTGTQTFAGSKTFTNTVTFGTDIKVNGMNLGRPVNPFNTPDYQNTALGIGVLGKYNPTVWSQDFNTGIGYYSLFNLTTGARNTATGSTSLWSLTTGGFNSAYGTDALSNLTSGSNNTALGVASGRSITTNSNNTMVGSYAGNLVTGSNNIFIGSNNTTSSSTGSGVTTGSSNTIIGSGIRSLSATLSNNVILADGDGNIRAQHNGTSGWTLGTIVSGTWSGTTIGSNVGGAGSVNGLMKANGSGVVSAAVAGTDYLTPTGSAASLTNFPTLNQNTTGNASTATLAGDITATSNTTLTSLANLATVGIITSGTWSATEIAIAKGGTGATTAAGALTNLGAEASANKSTDITADAASTTKYPSVKTIKDYVDTRVASAGVSDGSVTNVKLANSTTTLGSTTMTLGGTVTSVTGLSALSATNLTGALTGNASTATALATGRAISTTGDVTYTSGNFDGTADVTGVATLAASGVSSGTYGSSTAIPVLTVDTKGRVTSASTVGIIAGVNSLNYTSTTSYAAGGTISGTSLTLAAASATNPGLISTGAQTIAGAKTFSSDVTATNFLGNATTATTATTAGNITATSNTSLTSLTNLATVGTITTGTWSATEIAIAKGGTGATTASGARTNLGLGSIATKSTIANADVASGAAIDFSKLNITRADISGLGIQDGLTAGSGISISAGTISVTGLTTSNLASNAAITNAQLANSTTILGSTTMTLGGTVTSVAGLTSVSSTGFTGALTGNASTATKLAATKNINGVAFDGSADITVAADAGTLSGTTLKSTITSSSLTGVGTITSGTWNGSVLTPAYGGTGLTSLGSGIASFLATPTSANLNNAVTDETGSGSLVFATSPTLVTPNLGTPSAVTLTNATGLPVSTGITGLGTGIATFLATPTSSNLAATLSDETGSGGLVFATSPTLVTPNIGTASGTSLSLSGAITSGTWSASTIGVAFGGTGLTSPGASGNVLTSNGTAWVSSALSAVTSLGTFTTTAYAKGGVINGNTLTLSAADGTYPGLVSIADQTFAGAKTFSSDIIVNEVTVGKGPSSVISNTALGKAALRNNGATGTFNVAVGMEALQNNSTGTNNTALGYRSGFTNSASTNNTFLGSQSGYNNLSGSKNVAVGSSALYGTSNYLTGDGNNAIGFEAMKDISTTAADNIAIGLSAGTKLTTGTKNIFIGSLAGKNISTGSSANTTGLNSVLIGYDVRPKANADDNEIVISGWNGTAGTVGLGSNTTLIGSSTTTDARIMGALNLPNLTASTSTTTGALTVGGGAGIAGALNVGGATTITGAATISNTTASSSTTTGALKVGGGAGIVGNVNVGGTLGVTEATTLSTLTASGNATLTSLTTTGAATFSSTVSIPTGAGLNKVLTSDANGGATWKSAVSAVTRATLSSAGTTNLTTDQNYYIVLSTSVTGQVINLPDATANAGKEYTIKNLSAFSLNITATAGKLVQDNSTTSSNSASVGIEPSNNWIKVISDGTDWIVFRALF